MQEADVLSGDERVGEIGISRQREEEILAEFQPSL